MTPADLHERLVPVPGARNLRDMGGYRTADGRTVRRRMLLRSGHPGNLTPDGHEHFRRLGIRAILDLRTTEERNNLPWPAGVLEGVDYSVRDHATSGGTVKTMMRDPSTTPAAMRERMIRTYETLIEDQAEGIAAMFRLVGGGQVPLLINCTAGKDRTGVSCAILLAALGVPEDTVREDYALTEKVQDPTKRIYHIDPEGPSAFLLTVDPEVWRVMMRSDPEYIDAMFAGLRRRHGSVESYLADAHGLGRLELAALRDRLLEAG